MVFDRAENLGSSQTTHGSTDNSVKNFRSDKKAEIGDGLTLPPIYTIESFLPGSNNTVKYVHTLDIQNRFNISKVSRVRIARAAGILFSLSATSAERGALRSYLSPIEQEKLESAQRDMEIRATNLLSSHLERDLDDNHVATLVHYVGSRSASLKFGMSFEECVNLLMGRTAELQFSGHASDLGEAENQKLLGKDLSTESLKQYQYALQAFQAFFPEVNNDPQSNVARKVQLALPQLSGIQHTVDTDKQELQQLLAPLTEWQDTSKHKKEKSKKHNWNRRLGEEPMYRTLIETNTKVQVYDGIKRVKNPVTYYNPDLFLID